LNRNIFRRRNEVIIQSYYQLNLIGSTYFQPVLSYIPSPGAAPGLKSAWVVTLRSLRICEKPFYLAETQKAQRLLMPNYLCRHV